MLLGRAPRIEKRQREPRHEVRQPVVCPLVWRRLIIGRIGRAKLKRICHDVGILGSSSSPGIVSSLPIKVSTGFGAALRVVVVLRETVATGE